MRLLFVDETGDQKFKEYLGFCIASIDSRSYPLLKKKALGILARLEWDPSIEFKGAYLFSQSQGDPKVGIEQRIEASRELIALNAGTNSRMRFSYGTMSSSNPAGDYLAGLPSLIHKTLPKAPPGAGKDLIAVFCDERHDVKLKDLDSAVAGAVEARGYVLLEQVVQVRSHVETVGVMLADLVGYLAARVDTISRDVELFQGLTEEQVAANGKLRKLRSSTDLIKGVKSLELYRHDD